MSEQEPQLDDEGKTILPREEVVAIYKSAQDPATPDWSDETVN